MQTYGHELVLCKTKYYEVTNGVAKGMSGVPLRSLHCGYLRTFNLSAS
jgi:hypothetical protein